ncbi:hypothetical protein [Kordia jejudonensis]|uniref:hypothetical protein n=1 Tax=Kordia jejudonensis TaxID=1348245 RepID=UPI000AA36967|nr:hypothetical protein [Kordia jejudonensis]
MSKQKQDPSDVNRGNQLNPNNEEFHKVREVDPNDSNRANQLNPNNKEYKGK